MEVMTTWVPGDPGMLGQGALALLEAVASERPWRPSIRYSGQAIWRSKSQASCSVNGIGSGKTRRGSWRQQ